MVDPSSYPIPRRPRYESLDLWRGAACLMIVVFHSQGYQLASFPDAVRGSREALAGQIGWHGVLLDKALIMLDVGVPIFFVISGYCIAATCDSSRRKSHSFRHFYARRFCRIFPPYWIYLIAVASIFAAMALLGRPRSALATPWVIITSPWDLGFWSLLGTVCLTSTWQDRLIGPGGMMSGQAWSLCYEEQFYLVAGLLLWWSPRRLYLGVAVVSAAVLALFLAAPRLGLDLHGFFFDGFWLLFAAGFLVFYRVNYASRRGRWAADAVLLLSLAVVVGFGARTGWFNAHFFPAGIAFALLLGWLHPWDRAIAEARPLRPLAFCGRMCYSLYLVHYPIAAIVAGRAYAAGIRGFWTTILITVPASLVLSIAAAHLFAVLVERRFQPRSEVPPPRPMPEASLPGKGTTDLSLTPM